MKKHEIIKNIKKRKKRKKEKKKIVKNNDFRI